MVADYRPTHHFGPRMLSDAQQLYGTATSSPSCSSSLSCLSLSVLPPSNPLVFVFALPEASLFHFASLCLHLSLCILSRSAPAPSCIVCLYPTLDLFIHRWCIFCLIRVYFLPVAVVSWILPHSQPGPERLWVLLQDQRVEKEVAGAVWHGHVSVCFLFVHSDVTLW